MPRDVPDVIWARGTGHPRAPLLLGTMREGRLYPEVLWAKGTPPMRCNAQEAPLLLDPMGDGRPYPEVLILWARGASPLRSYA